MNFGSIAATFQTGGLVGQLGPLSPSQQRIWFLQRYDPDDPAYRVVSIQRLHGRLDVPVLLRAVQEIVRRHEPLRTRFVASDGLPAQEVLDDAPVPFDQVDLRGRPDAGERLLRLVERWGDRPFDLGQVPLLRVGLARLGDEDHLLVVCAHHLVADGWSMAVFRAELAALYEAFTAGAQAEQQATAGLAAPLAPLAASFADHVARERERAAGAGLERAVAYWTGQLAGVPALVLPTDRPRQASGTRVGPAGPRGDVFRVAVQAELLAGVAGLARSLRCTPFMVWLAAYQVLLCRAAGQDEVCVGSAIAGRDRCDEESLIGYFTATVALRGDLSGDPSFAQLVKQARTTVIEAHSHGTIPFEQVTSALPAARDRTRNPLFQTWFTMHTQNAGGHRTRWGPQVEASMPQWPPPAGSAVEQGPIDRSYDIMVDFWPGEDAAELALTYDRELFDRQTIVEFVGRLLRLVESVVADPDRPVSQVSLLAPGERGSILDNRVPGAAATPASVVELVLDQCRRTPGAPAVVSGADVRSYARLDADSAAVAATLRAAGLGPGDVVGIRLPRSPELVAALLGTLRAGAAYLPLDPSYPDARVELMLRDSGAAAVLTDAAGASRLDGCGLPVITEIGPAPELRSGPDLRDQPESAAYVIYTSGSSGTPKGVVVEHASLAARVAWMRQEYGLTAADRVAQFASLSFDTHAEEIYPVLAAGGAVVLPTLPSERFPEWLAGPDGRTVTVLDLPTAYWHQLVHDLRPQTWPPALRLMIIGGSAADGAAVRAWREIFGDRVTLVNTYGPTETTIVATATELGAADAVGRPPIGRPAAGTAAYVLDPAGRPVPAGMPGELCLAGAGVARGYLGRPELTERAFRPDPYGPPGSRMFRTGDRARLLRDGRLEYLGRLDRQLKVRGYRIEPGEIEAALTAHAGVAQALVTVRDDSLVGYVVPAPPADAAGGNGPQPAPPADGAGGNRPQPAPSTDAAGGNRPQPAPPAAPSAAELRSHLRRQLPAYLVPNAFVVLDRLPLTRSGKPDLAALPAPSEVSTEERRYVAPRTDAEALVAEIWAEVLGRPRVGALDDFFELGGHSLLATRVIARLRAETDVELSLRAMFATPTVAGVAEEVERLLQAEIDALSDDEVARQLTEATQR